MPASSRHSRQFLFIAILLLGINLRPILAVVGPLLEQIQQATGLDDSQAGLLTTLPILAMGICALYGGWLQRHLGEYRGILLGITIIMVACLVRFPWDSRAGLLVSAALGGVGIALIQALVPSFIKRFFLQRSSLLMGLYTTGIMAGAAVAAATASPLSGLAGWSGALAFWGILAFIALLVWRKAPSSREAHEPNAIYHPAPHGLQHWALMLFFGIGTGAYSLVLAWLPPYYMQLGWSAAQSGFLLGGLTLTEVCAGLAVSALISRFPDRRMLLVPILVLLLAGMMLLLIAPLSLAFVAMVLLGMGIGALFPLSLIVALDHATNVQETGRLMGFVQGGGYIIASVMPTLAGVIRQHTEGLEQAWTIMAWGVVVLIVMAFRFRPLNVRKTLGR
ncbi:MFS transporter [Candidatus Symbiopectobacterium sp. NZEC151]|uniref:MFS transporter n=2 Tax=unclassified Symbiopectobacterium TaxID=2794573 RepID=UPI0022273530|nr:MFS transporter [Candidatus Symbiopectobacterium sp. NZEC151]MCW2473367.1 MFS transporter [Candidatus Symbiopectobacterium sp. NZEC151]